MIQLEHLFKSYPTSPEPVIALADVSLEVSSGEIFGIIGKSGAGKSTLLRCVNALERPDSGRVWVAGKEVLALSHAELRALRQRMGMIFQHFHLLSSQTIFDNVALPLRLNGMIEKNIRDTVMPLLDLVGLSDKALVYPAQLSGGQKQRVAIARALVHRPQLLLCDEATSALDPQTTLSILDLLRDIRDQFNLTILLITHDMQVIKNLCDRVALLDQGTCIEVASVMHFFQQPQTLLARELVHSTLKHDVPALLLEKVSAVSSVDRVPLWRIWFKGRATIEPLMIEMYKRFGVQVSILQANIEWIHHSPTGIMLAAIDADNGALDACHDFLIQHHITIETLGYVQRDIFTIDSTTV